MFYIVLNAETTEIYQHEDKEALGIFGVKAILEYDAKDMIPFECFDDFCTLVRGREYAAAVDYFDSVRYIDSSLSVQIFEGLEDLEEVVTHEEILDLLPET